jgi:hypothetical protein
VAEINGKTLVKVTNEDIIDDTYEIPEYITIIGKEAFIECQGINRLVIPETVVKIEQAAVAKCESLEVLEIIGEVNTLANMSFALCPKLKTVKMSDYVEVIEDYVFSGCTSLEEIEFSKKLKVLGNWVFAECESLRNVILPDSVKTIGFDVFLKCDNLEFVSIPDSAYGDVGRGLVRGCMNLKKIKLPSLNLVNNQLEGCTRIGEIECNNEVMEVINISNNIYKIEEELKIETSMKDAKFYRIYNLQHHVVAYIAKSKDIMAYSAEVEQLESRLKEEIKKRFMQGL